MLVKGSDLLIIHPKAVFGEITVTEITGNAWKGVKRRKRNERGKKTHKAVRIGTPLGPTNHVTSMKHTQSPYIFPNIDVLLLNQYRG